MTLVLALFGVRPGSLDSDGVPMAEMLARFGTTVFANTLAYGEAQRVATQLKDSVAARAVTDQAKGILMHALGCDADEALKYLRRESQRRHIKVTDVAARVIATYAPGGPVPPAAAGGTRPARPGGNGSQHHPVMRRGRPTSAAGTGVPCGGAWLRRRGADPLVGRGAAPDAVRLAGASSRSRGTAAGPRSPRRAAARLLVCPSAAEPWAIGKKSSGSAERPAPQPATRWRSRSCPSASQAESHLFRPSTTPGSGRAASRRPPGRPAR